MHYHKILVPMDFSDHSLEALRMASILGAETGAVLHMVHVWQPTPPLADGVAWAEVYSEQDENARKQLESIEPYRLDVKCCRHVLSGDPSTEIVKFATDEDVDLIVVGTHGRSGLTRLVLGSVAEHIMRRAPCPVLTCKIGIIKKTSKPTATH